MGAKAEEPREFVLTLRLTRKERIQLEGQVDRAGYHSVSRYIREKILEGKRIFRNDRPLTGQEVRDRLNAVSTEISRFGNDYSRIAGELSEAVRNRTPVNPRTASVNLTKLVRLSHSIKGEMDRLLTLFQEIDNKTGSYCGEPVVFIKEKKTMLQKIEIIGNLVSDAELKSSQDGKQFMVFRVVINETVGDERRSTFYDVSHPNSGIFKYLKKGKSVYVSGRLWLGINTWEGKSYLNARIYAKDIELCGPWEE